MNLEGIIDINGLAEFKTKMEELVNESLSYTEKIFAGMGIDEHTEMTPYEVGRSHEIIIRFDSNEVDDCHVYLAYPKNCSVSVIMGGFEMPFENLTETIIDDRVYMVDRSINTYSGILEVGLILKY